MKTNIKLRVTPEQSEAVQKICFANGINWDGTGKFYHLSKPFIYIYELSIRCDDKESSRYFRNHENKEIDADLFIRTNGTCEEPIDIVDNMLNSKSKDDMFKQYGFEVPDFNCIILTKVGSWLIGYTQKGSMAPIPAMWFEHTGESSGSSNLKVPNLTPIKQPWYETCKFPILVWDEDSHLYSIQTRKEHTNTYLNKCKPLSNEEIDQLKQDF